uniref:Uncharacterized protein n=1 Tax=viral metagenome TaxID=1070528 RepID=A0A6M3Y020_9ZZZZ
MADKGPFVRKPLLCPKCQGSNLFVQEIREMFESPRADQMPMFSGGVKNRVVCADCSPQVIVWPVKPEKGK